VGNRGCIRHRGEGGNGRREEGGVGVTTVCVWMMCSLRLWQWTWVGNRGYIRYRGKGGAGVR